VKKLGEIHVESVPRTPSSEALHVSWRETSSVLLRRGNESLDVGRRLSPHHLCWHAYVPLGFGVFFPSLQPPTLSHDIREAMFKTLQSLPCEEFGVDFLNSLVSQKRQVTIFLKRVTQSLKVAKGPQSLLIRRHMALFLSACDQLCDHWMLTSCFLKKFLLYFCCTGVQCDIYKSAYSISELNSPLPSFSFTPHSPILRIASIGLLFPFSYLSTYFYHIHPPKPFPYIIPPFSLVLTSTQDLIYILSSISEEKTFLCV
jgi:hypothetical protein